MLSKLRQVLDIKTVSSVYYAIFESNLCYASLVWAQNTDSVKRLHLLQKNSLRIMFFQSKNSHAGPLLKLSKILKCFDKTALENCIFISKSLNTLLPSIFNNWFKFSFESHSHDTRCSNFGYLKIRSYRRITYGRYSMFVNLIYVWNHLQSCHQNVIFHQLRANKSKEILITFFLNRYNLQLPHVFTNCQFYTEQICFEAYLGLFPSFWPAIRELSAVIVCCFNTP